MVINKHTKCSRKTAEDRIMNVVVYWNITSICRLICRVANEGRMRWGGGGGGRVGCMHGFQEIDIQFEWF